MPKKKSSGEGKQGLRVVPRNVGAGGGIVYYARGTIAGKTIFQSLKTGQLDLAEEACAALATKLYRAAIHGIEEKPRVTFAAAATAYLKRATDTPISQHTKMALARIATHFGPHVYLDQIDQDRIDAMGAALCRGDAKAATILRAVVTPIKAVMTFAAERGWCPAPKFRKTKGGGGGRRTDWFRPAEAEALIASAASHLKPLVTFLFCTGARMGEAVALDWANVELEHSRVTLVGGDDETGARTKSGHDRIVDLPPRAVAALASLPGEREGRVFLHPVGNPDVSKEMAPYRLSGENKHGSGGGQIKRAWATAMKGAGIKRSLSPHHTRHTWATWHYLVHKDLIQLRQDGGWHTTQMCERYAKLAPAGLRDDVTAFWAGKPAVAITARAG